MELTAANTGRSLAFLLDDQIRVMATIRDRFGDRCQLSGDFSHDDVQSIVAALKAGRLPARLKFVEEIKVPVSR
jgi:preprotein translocase subunit SecD